MKKCSICNKEKGISQYFKNYRSRDGLQQHCKSCHKVMADKWNKENIEVKREIRRKAMAVYRKKYPTRIKKLRKKYWKLHGEKYKKTARDKSKKLRQDIITKYGGKCECCGIDDYRFLCLDHKDNDGYKHRKSIRAGWLLHKWIIKNNYPKNIRVLCFNCNFARAFYGGKDKICPHQLARRV